MCAPPLDLLCNQTSQNHNLIVFLLLLAYYVYMAIFDATFVLLLYVCGCDAWRNGATCWRYIRHIDVEYLAMPWAFFPPLLQLYYMRLLLLLFFLKKGGDFSVPFVLHFRRCCCCNSIHVASRRLNAKSGKILGFCIDFDQIIAFFT